MSYLGRITGRMAGPRQRPGLIPAGRVASPLAIGDQRLHLIGTGALGEVDRMGVGGVADDPLATTDSFDGAATPLGAARPGDARAEGPAERRLSSFLAPSPRAAPGTAATGDAQTARSPRASGRRSMC